MRISRDEYLMNEAINASKRSTCNRLQVGAVIVREGRPIIAGYNGAPSGFPHCDPSVCRLDQPCTRTIHAEVNCIYFAARYGIEILGTSIYTTDSPCDICAKAIIQAGIVEVVFKDKYRDHSPLILLEASKIKTRWYKPDAS